MALINTIYEAIGDRRVLAFTYKGKDRTAEPYIVGYDEKSKLVLSAVQLSGGSGHRVSQLRRRRAFFGDQDRAPVQRQTS